MMKTFLGWCVLVVLVGCAPLAAQVRPGAFTTVVTTNTGAASIVVGGATPTSTTGTGGINMGPLVATTGTFSSTVSATIGTFSTTGTAQLLVLQSTNNSGQGIVFKDTAASGKFNWLISSQNNVDNGLEFSPSTATNGTTFTTPMFKITQTGTATLTGLIDITSPSPFTTLRIATWDALGWDGSNAIKLGGFSASQFQALKIYTNNALRWGINSDGDWTFGASSHIADSNGTPSYTSGSTGATIAGTDYAFTLTVGNTSDDILVTFGHTFSNVPPCVATSNNAPAGAAVSAVGTQSSTTQVHLFSGNQVNTGGKIYVLCRGY